MRSRALTGRMDFAAEILAGVRSPTRERFSRRMLLALSLLFLIAGLLFFRIDRQTAHYCRDQLHRPFWKLALRVTDWAKGLPWIIAA